jgi:hypothetical protein
MMTDRARQRRARLEELLVQRATEVLDPAAEARLDRLLDEFPDNDAQCYERAAAAVCLAALSEADTMPVALREKIVLRGNPSDS